MKIKTTLTTVSFLTLMAVSLPAMADTNVLCSVRANAGHAAGVNYQPGVDAKGRAVVPADVSASGMTVPKSLTIPLTVDLAQRMNDVLPSGSKLEAEVGLIEVQQDGRVMINGKDMTGPADTMCATVAKQKSAALKTSDAPKVVRKKKPAMVAKPVEPVTAETIAPETPKVEATTAPVPPTAPTPAASPAPQVLEATPPPMPTPAAAPSAAPSSTVPAPEAGMPTPPPSGAAVPAAEGLPKPPSPLDPLSAPSPVPAPGTTPSTMSPTPANTNPATNGGTLSGGAQ